MSISLSPEVCIYGHWSALRGLHPGRILSPGLSGSRLLILLVMDAVSGGVENVRSLYGSSLWKQRGNV